MSAANQEKFDLVLTGGRLFDPATVSWAERDLAIRDGQVTTIAEVIEPERARSFADISGLLVTPSLTDIHVHCYPGATYWGIDLDQVSLAHGVTTVVDAGSAGAYTFEGLKRLLTSARVRARAFLNIAGGGLASPYGELLVPEMADIEAAVRVARTYPDLIVGFKLRASPNTVGQHGTSALAAVRRAADEAGLRIMVHISEPPPDLATVLAHLRAGDILTHCFTPYDNCVVDTGGNVRPEVQEAVRRGVLLDVGHGSGSFSFAAAEAYLDSGLKPAIISTDLHSRSVLGPAFNMGTVMTKMLASGSSLTDVLRSVTTAPAAILGHEASLDVGSVADIAVFDVEQRPLKVWDSLGSERVAPKRMTCRLTVLKGEVVFVEESVRLQRA